MLSIGLVSSASGARHYYEKDDYYHTEAGAGGGPTGQGEWFGRGAARLGLTGSAEPEAFVAILDGLVPGHDALGTMQDGERKHTPGWDLTFSAPKSASILIELGRDERLLAAHEAAARTALTWAEDHAIGVRQRSPVGRLFRRTQSMVAALFTHHTSRNQDPNTHTHSVVANMTEKEPEVWASVQSHALFDAKMAIGVIYRADFAQRALALGYAIEVTHRDGRFEIVDVPKEVVRHFSSRRVEVEASLEERGLEGAEAAAKATLMTRAHKRVLEMKDLITGWLARAQAYKFDAAEPVRSARTRGPAEPPGGVTIEIALNDAIDRLSESETTFTHADLVRYTLQALVGRAGVAEVETAILKASHERRLLRVDLAGREQWTTVRAHEQEKHILRAITEGQGRMKPIIKPERLEKILNQRSTLNDEQRPAVEFILTTTDQFVGIEGLPGTGKTTRVLKTAAEIAKRQRVSFVGMAQNANAARNLELEADIPSMSVLRHLNRVGPDIAAIANAHPLHALVIRHRYRNQVWVIDEAAQLPNGLQRRLTFAAQKLGVRVLAVGDPGQFGAIEAGKPFQLALERGMSHVKLVNMQRQKVAEHASALTDARDGQIDQALNRLAPWIIENEDRAKRLGSILQRYRGLSPTDRAETLLVTARNAEKRVLNQGVRAIRIEEGEISGSRDRTQLVKVFSRRADRRDATFYKAGWLVRFSRGISALGIQADEYWAVAGVDPKTNRVTLRGTEKRDGEAVVWNPREVGASNKRAAEIYQEVETELAPGEPVRWGRNAPKEYGLLNGQIVTVHKVDEHTTTFLTEEGKKIKVDHRALNARHWDHAYASTVYSSQGRTIRGVIVNAESDLRELFSQRAFVVAISRHELQLSFYTDNREKLEKTLRRHLGHKSSAIESMELSMQAEAALEQTEASRAAEQESARRTLRLPAPRQR